MKHKILNRSRRILLALLLVIPLCGLRGQTAQFEWVKQTGGTGNDAGREVVVDDAGNIYVAGEFSGTVDFDPGPGVLNLTSVSNTDAYVAKYTPAGALVWATRIAAAPGSPILTIDDSGNLYYIPSGGAIVKLNNAGTILWNLPVNFTYAYGITTDNAGNVYIAGIFLGTVDFDHGPGVSNLTAAATYNAFVLKINPNGDLIWARPILSNSNLQAVTIMVGFDQRLYISGYFMGIGDFDGGPGVANLTAGTSPAAFIAKWDLSGNYIWAKTTQGAIGVTGTAYGQKLAPHPLSSNFYLAGRFTGTVDFDIGTATLNLTANGCSDVFVMQIDSSGIVAWAKKMGGSGGDFAYGLAVDSTGAAYTAGRSGNLNADFDPGVAQVLLPYGGGSGDIFVSKLDGNGNYAWARSMGSNGLDDGRGLAVDRDLNVYTTGFFQSTADFNTGPGMIPETKTSSGANDIFLHKFSQFICVPVYDTFDITACESYYFNNQLLTTSGNYTDTFVNTSGCDSLFTLALTITPPFTDTLIQGACDSFVYHGEVCKESGVYTYVYTSALNCDSTYTLILTLNDVNTLVTRVNNTLTADAIGATYQWINCNGDIPVPGATGNVFSPAVNGAYAVIITENACTDTSYCYAVTGLTDLYTLDASTSVSLYPNPTQGNLSVAVSRPLKNATINIVNMVGQTLQSRRQLTGSNIAIDITSYPAGVYFLELQEDGARAKFKFVKN